ncbi:helix-turn-helix domain-containing protein [bacterium]|nr:helix-turn-helix domain-containing protein [bacterium]
MDELALQQTGRDIKERRQTIGASQEELAKEAGVSYRTVLRFEKGNKIRDEKLSKMVSALEKLEKSRQSQKSQSLWWLSHKRADTDSFKGT